jgi:regulator of protease activity HflC (stomatin/prohibitin superfamily)
MIDGGGKRLRCSLLFHGAADVDDVAIAKQAEAERIRRAKIIDAEGEQQAAEKLAQAGQILADRPEAMQLRYLTALGNIAGDRSSTIVFPLPMDLFEKLRPR